MTKICLIVLLLLTNACISTPDAQIQGSVISIQSIIMCDYDNYLIEQKAKVFLE